jgi:putative transposase
MQNGFMESFNGRLRGECLNRRLFTGYRHARDSIEEWSINYNVNRPHTSLDGLTPNECATRSVKDHNVNRANLSTRTKRGKRQSKLSQLFAQTLAPQWDTVIWMRPI